MKTKQSLSPQKRLTMTFHLQKALRLLQMSQVELKMFLQEELEKNPFLEEIAPPISNISLEEIPYQESIYSKIITQITENFSEKSDQEIAKILLEHLNEKGFLSISLEEIQNEHSIALEKITSILNTMQTFHPPGIFARNLQESLLLQLKALKMENTSAYHIAKHFFSDLLHGRYKKIQKESNIDHVKEAIHILSKLRLHPMEEESLSHPVIEDFTLTQENEHWDYFLNESILPKISLQTHFETIELKTPEEKELVQHWTDSAKWLLRSLKKRRQLLMKIVFYILKYQIGYLLGNDPLKPLTLQEAASHLQVHESTVSRAISHKYIKTPKGLISIRSLFTLFPSTQTAKQVLEEIIRQENKEKPFKDQDLVIELQKKGIQIARRTVAKYRKELKIQPMALR